MIGVSFEQTTVDAARIKISMPKGRVSFEPIVVSDGIRKYKVVIYPVVEQEDV